MRVLLEGCQELLPPRFVFDQAVERGGHGRPPLILGDAEADQAFQDAFRFLKSLEPVQTTWEDRQRDVETPPQGFALRRGKILVAAAPLFAGDLTLRARISHHDPSLGM